MTRLQKLRIDALLSVEQLADATGVPARTIYRLEAGSNARVETLGKLAGHFEVPASELLAEVPSPEGAPR